MSAEPAGTSVLVVDDDPTIRLLARAALEPAGLRVRDAASGEAALEAVAEAPPDLVLLDVQLPDADGVALCQRLREASPGELPVVMMTATEDAEVVQRSYDAGATDFVAKPVPWPTLVHRVLYILQANVAFSELHESQRQLAVAQRIARIGSWSLSPDGTHVSLSEEACRVVGLSLEDKLPLERVEERVSPEERGSLRSTFVAAMREGRPFEATVRLEENGAYLAVRGERVGGSIRGTVQDVTAQTQNEEQIRYLAYHDSLTGLGNRLAFKERLDEAIERARQSGRHLGIIFLDLDNFKRINDTLGHSAGDRLLREVSERLRSAVRFSDSIQRMSLPPPELVVSRLGGDEFTVLVENMKRPLDLAKVAVRIQRMLPEPIVIDGYELMVTGSMGLATSPSDGDDLESLLRKADTAMYDAKSRGRNGFQFYSESINATAMERIVLEGRLRRALERNELEVAFQPQVDATTLRIVGAEALARWRTPDGTMVSPAEFIPLAEEIGLIDEIGDRVLGTACALIAEWREHGLTTIPLSVNVSAHQVNLAFVSRVRERLEEHGLTGRDIELELTESALMQDDERVVPVLDALKRLGVRLALDDFGTGYSSLSLLRRYPVDILKIDCSFVQALETDHEARGVTLAVLQLAETLGLRSVAEGVENEGQRTLLIENGCERLQGHLTGEPRGAADLTALLGPESPEPRRSEPGR